MTVEEIIKNPIVNLKRATTMATHLSVAIRMLEFTQIPFGGNEADYHKRLQYILKMLRDLYTEIYLYGDKFEKELFSKYER